MEEEAIHFENQVHKNNRSKKILVIIAILTSISIGINALLLVAKPISVTKTVYQKVPKQTAFSNLEVIDDSGIVKGISGGGFNGKEVLLVGKDIWRYKDGKYEKITKEPLPYYENYAWGINNNSNLLASDGESWLIGGFARYPDTDEPVGTLYFLKHNDLRRTTNLLPFKLRQIIFVSFIPKSKIWLIGGLQKEEYKPVLLGTKNPLDPSSYVNLTSKLEKELTFEDATNVYSRGTDFKILSYSFAIWNGEKILVGGSGLALTDANLENAVKLDSAGQPYFLSALWVNGKYILVSSSHILETADGSSYTNLSPKMNVQDGFSSMAALGNTLYINSNYGLVSYDGKDIIDLRPLLVNFNDRVGTIVAGKNEIFVSGDGFNRIIINKNLD